MAQRTRLAVLPMSVGARKFMDSSLFRVKLLWTNRWATWNRLNLDRMNRLWPFGFRSLFTSPKKTESKNSDDQKYGNRNSHSNSNSLLITRWRLGGGSVAARSGRWRVDSNERSLGVLYEQALRQGETASFPIDDKISWEKWETGHKRIRASLTLPGGTFFPRYSASCWWLFAKGNNMSCYWSVALAAKAVDQNSYREELCLLSFRQWLCCQGWK